MNANYSFPKGKIKILLLEGISERAVAEFEQHGYQVEVSPDALSEQELTERIRDIHILGVRSKTQVCEQVLSKAEKLLGIGCFCIGTDQVALDKALTQGVVVFNAPFSNTRSVAELTIAATIMLSRNIPSFNALMHQGIWRKSAQGSHEVRGKTIGIVGFGRIGQQVSILAESLGMKVVFYDIDKKLPLGNSKSLDSLSELLAVSDFVTLHVPDTEHTCGMIGEAQLAAMKEGAALINYSRGSVVDIDALCLSLAQEKLSGAAIDVYPQEPKTNAQPFSSPLMEYKNVLLTPHIGGSTQEAQRNIGHEVASSLVSYLDVGVSVGSVNFPQVELPAQRGNHRILHIHKNVPGVLSSINGLVAKLGANIEAQYLRTNESIGYLVMDLDSEVSSEVKLAIEGLESTIKTRILF